MIYIGMKPAESTLEELQGELDIAYQKRKQEQASWLLRTSGSDQSLALSLSREKACCRHYCRTGYLAYVRAGRSADGLRSSVNCEKTTYKADEHML